MWLLLILLIGECGRCHGSQPSKQQVLQEIHALDMELALYTLALRPQGVRLPDGSALEAENDADPGGGEQAAENDTGREHDALVALADELKKENDAEDGPIGCAGTTADMQIMEYPPESEFPDGATIQQAIDYYLARAQEAQTALMDFAAAVVRDVDGADVGVNPGAQKPRNQPFARRLGSCRATCSSWMIWRAAPSPWPIRLFPTV